MTFRPGERMDQTRLGLLVQGLAEPEAADLLPLLAEVAYLSPLVATKGIRSLSDQHELLRMQHGNLQRKVRELEEAGAKLRAELARGKGPRGQGSEGGAQALSAIRYALRRMRTDPDFRHYMLGTETFAQLAEAYALLTGKDVAGVREFYSMDAQPVHRRREPDVVVLRRLGEERELNPEP